MAHPIETSNLPVTAMEQAPRKLRKFLRQIETAFLVFVVLSQVYYWYRYALQEGSTSTSPTYDNTPYAFQIGKYLLALAYLGTLCVIWARRYQSFKIPTSFIWSAILAGAFFAAMVLKYGITQDWSEKILASTLIKTAYVVPVIAVTIPFLANAGFLKRFKYWAIDAAMGYHVVYSAVQITLYFAIARLPGLAYEDGIVRFGGGWDDPNGFGLFLTLPFLYLITSKPRGFGKKGIAVAYGAVIVALLLATVSYSSVIGFLIAFALCALLTNLRTFLALFVATSAIAGAVAASTRLQELIQFNFEEKRDSMQAHLDQTTGMLDFLNGDTTVVLFGQGSQFTFAEDFYQMILYNFGLVFLLIFATVIIATVVRAFQKFYRAKRLKDEEGERLFLIGICFLTAFSLASAMIPFFAIYPLNIYFWIYALLMWIYPVNNHREMKANL